MFRCAFTGLSADNYSVHHGASVASRLPVAIAARVKPV
jgi:hypothetical protein